MRRPAVNHTDRRGAQAGYTLIEMAVVMLIVGIMVAAAIPLYKLYLERVDREDTMVTQKQIDIALATFKNLRGRYPCPARYDAKPGDADYGMETECFGSTEAPGTCVNGICYESSVRQIDIGAGMIYPRIERGALPFASLGLSEDQSIDAYGGRFSYAVTELLTDKSTYRPLRGGISIVDGSGPPPKSIIEPEGSAHYFVFSHGPDNIGAYNAQGELIHECNGPMFDNENCNTDGSNPQAIYRHALQSTEQVVTIDAGVVVPGSPPAGVNTHYDDFVDFIGIGRQPTWEFAEDGDNEMTDTINLHDAIDKKVIIGEDAVIDPLYPSVMVQVEGDAKVEGTRTAQVCSEDGICIESAVIGGEETDPRHLACDTAGAPTAIANSRIVCGPITTSAACPAGQIMYGVDDNGLPLCRAYVSTRCPATTRNICGVNTPLNQTSSGVSVTLTGGASYSQTFTCNNTVWQDGPPSGVCDCTAGTVNTTASCGPNMSGQINVSTTTVCPSGQQTVTQDTSTCTCQPSTTTRSVACGVGYSGTITYTDDVTCNGNTPVTTTTETANACVCENQTQTRIINCPSGFSGTINQSRSNVCPDTTFGNWANTSNSCACNPSTVQIKACPPQYNAGAITETCSYNCSGGINQPAPYGCHETANTCACNGGTVETTSACPAGYTGTIKTKVKTVCPGNTQTTETENNCEAITMTCTFRVTGSQAVTTGKQGPAENSSCEYTLFNNPCAIQYCHRPVGAGIYETYNCNCE